MQNHPIHKNAAGFTLIELVIEVDGSREVTFSEWNSKSTEERKEITAEVRRQDKTFCQYQQRTLPPDFFARYESCPDKQLWVP